MISRKTDITAHKNEYEFHRLEEVSATSSFLANMNEYLQIHVRTPYLQSIPRN
jgi:hypothetical protein